MTDSVKLLSLKMEYYLVKLQQGCTINIHKTSTKLKLFLEVLQTLIIKPWSNESNISPSRAQYSQNVILKVLFYYQELSNVN